MRKGSGTFFVYGKFAVAECNEAMKAPVGLSSDRTVLRSKMEGPRPDKGYFKMRECCRSAVPEERNIFKN